MKKNSKRILVVGGFREGLMIDIDLKPGETARWDNRYTFEERLAQAGANR